MYFFNCLRIRALQSLPLLGQKIPFTSYWHFKSLLIYNIYNKSYLLKMPVIVFLFTTCFSHKVFTLWGKNEPSIISHSTLKQSRTQFQIPHWNNCNNELTCAHSTTRRYTTTLNFKLIYKPLYSTNIWLKLLFSAIN